MKKYKFSFIAKFLLLFILPIQLTAQSADLYNYQNSKQFATYLLKSGQFEMAIREYERLVYIDTQDDTLKLNLMKSYRYLGKFEQGVSRAKELYKPQTEMPIAQAVEYSKLLMNNRSWEEANKFWDESRHLSTTDKQLFKTSTAIFNNRFEEAKAHLNLVNDTTNFLATGYRTLIDESINGKYKSPFLAGSMSALLPGIGKVYTNDWKDGIVSLLFTAGMAFQSYRGFNKTGIKSTRGWIYGGIGLGFYLGNIYGSAKSAKNYNKKKINKLQHDASSLFNTYYAN